MDLILGFFFTLAGFSYGMAGVLPLHAGIKQLACEERENCLIFCKNSFLIGAAMILAVGRMQAAELISTGACMLAMVLIAAGSLAAVAWESFRHTGRWLI